MQSHFSILIVFKVKRSYLSAILNIYFWYFPPNLARNIGFLRIVSKEAKTTEKFHSKKNDHGTPRYDPTYW